MYGVTLNDDETITVDWWSRRIKAARLLRPDAWFEVVADWRREGGVLDFDPSAVQKLFLELQIDGARAKRMLNAKGNTAAAPIDPVPELAEAGENQVLVDENFNQKETFKALRTRLGIEGVCFQDEDDFNMFMDMRDTLKVEGILKPGMRGI